MRERARRGQEMFVPLAHSPGDAQADLGQAIVIIGGLRIPTKSPGHSEIMSPGIPG